MVDVKSRSGDDWRVIWDDAAPGAWNMAVDEAILAAHGRGESPPTLRFYGWSPPALTIGYFQKVEKQVDLEGCRRAGVDMVRRPTGGRAVLHHHEVTYSVVVRNSILPGSVEETYLALSQGLARGLASLGIPVDMVPAGRAQSSGAACFDAPSSYELSVGGRKLVGSAQCRAHGALLQHGSVLLKFEPDRLASLLRFSSEKARLRAARLLEGQAVGINQTGAGEFTFDQVARSLRRGLEEAWDLKMQTGELTPGEYDTAHQLLRDKYGTDTWNMRR